MMTVSEYKSLKLASDLRGFLLERPQLELQVHSAFETSINLLADEELITLAANCRELMPMGCIVDIEEVDQWKLKAEDIVLYDQGAFQLPQGETISLQNAEVEKVSMSESYDNDNGIDTASLRLVRKKLLESDGGGISDLAAWLPQTDKLDQTLNVYSKYIKDDLLAFMDSLKERDYETAVSLTKGLIGFGPGLTPSCDDFLTGIILLLYYEDINNDFFQEIVSLARERTTVVSYHMLKNAAAGKAYGSYLALIRTVAGRDHVSLEVLIDRVLHYGASSGSDFLFGVYCAGLILHEREKQVLSIREILAK